MVITMSQRKELVKKVWYGLCHGLRTGEGIYGLLFSAFLSILVLRFCDISERKISIIFSVLIIFIFVIVILYVIIYRYHNKRVSESIKLFSNRLSHFITEKQVDFPKGENICPYSGLLCSATKILKSDYYGRISSQLELDDKDCEKYNLVKDDNFNRLESDFFTDHPQGEIWIVSYALESEIKTPEELKKFPDDHDPLKESLKKSMETVEKNIVDKGGKYIQFVALGPQGKNDITFENRCRAYWNILSNLSDEERKEKMPIIRIDDGFSDGRQRESDPDFEYLVKLTTTILFVDNIEDNSNGQLFVEGYFCLRPDDSSVAKKFERRTIFFKMPNCMRDDYYYFLKDKRNEYFKKLNNEKSMGGAPDKNQCS